jgi:Tn3 transposase DDE domain
VRRKRQKLTCAPRSWALADGFSWLSPFPSFAGCGAVGRAHQCERHRRNEEGSRVDGQTRACGERGHDHAREGRTHQVRALHIGLNKGEARNALARAVFFYRHGRVQDRFHA